MEKIVTDLFQERDFTDFTVESEEGKKFPCHRAVLSVQSNVLKRIMLTEESRNGILSLNYKAEVVENFVNYFYTRKMIYGNLEDNLGSYLEIAERYNLPQIKKDVQDNAKRILNSENMVDMFLLADFYIAKNLMECAKKMIRKNRGKIMEKFGELEKLDKGQILKIIKILL